MRAVAIATIAMALLSAGAAGSTATLSGRVVDGTTHRPVRGAVVSLFYMGKRIGTVSGADGGFLLTGLPVGVFRLTATKSGYFDGAYGRRRLGSEEEPIELADGGTVANIELLVWAEAMISGAVIDEIGEPVAGVRVVAMPRDGDWSLGSHPFAVTDATGRYSIGKLKAGSYVVGTTVFYVFERDLALPGLTGPGQVTVSGALVPPFVMIGGKRNVYTGALYPDTDSTSMASVVGLAAGEEHSAVDLRLPLRSSVRVSGQVSSVTPAAPNQGLVVFWNDVVRLVAPIASDGSFSLAAVPAGRYAIDLASGSSTRAAGSVVVGEQDLSNIAVNAQHHATVSGLIQAPSRLPSGLQVVLTTPGTTRSVSGQITDGRFTFSDVAPGRYVARLGSGFDWTTESVELAGRDLSDTSFDVDGDVDGLVIHATNQPARVSGKVRLGNGAIAHGAAVVIFPVDTSQWGSAVPFKPIHFQRVRPNNGDYVIAPLPEGDYFIAAVDDALLESWPQRALLSAMAGTAERLRLARGDAAIRNLVMKDR
jgi:hypothetical protein